MVDIDTYRIAGLFSTIWETRIRCTSEEEQMDIVDKLNRMRWIPAEERLPENDGYVLLSFMNYTLPMIGIYEQDEDGGGAWYIGDCDEEDTCVANDLFVNAWMPLPKAYREENNEKD